MITTGRVASTFLMPCSSWMPSMPGILMSVMTTSNASVFTFSRASRPLFTVVTWNPSLRSTIPRNWVMLCSSSTTRIFSADIRLTPLVGSWTRTSGGPGRDSFHRARLDRRGRQADAHPRPLSRRTLEAECPAVPLDDALRDRDPQTGSLFLRGEERLPHVGEMLG